MDFDAVIIGTGFGATVAATQLIQKNKKVLMLERGLWWFTPDRPIPPYILERSKGDRAEQPVQYWPRPNHRDGLIDFLAVVRTNSPLENLRKIGEFFRTAFTGKLPPQPLYRYHMFPEIHIVTASGVGGGSLIYSNVTLEPKWDPAAKRYPVMDGWPLQLSPQDYQKAGAWMDIFRGKRNQVVTKIPLPPALQQNVSNLSGPEEFLYLGKSRALRRAAQALGAKWEPLNLAVFEYDGMTKPGSAVLNEAAANKVFCERQGRCFVGCLPGARHTLNKTILKKLLDVPNPLVTLRSLAEVESISAHPGGGYDVAYRDLRDDSTHSVTAPVVVLAAGCLGSTELLLRCRNKGTLTLSDNLGRRFSSNGDFAGFVVIPQTSDLYPIFPTRGPINTSHAMFQDGQLQMTVEDGAIPSMFAAVVGAALGVLENAVHRDSFMEAMRGVWMMGNLPDLQAFFPAIPNPSDPTRFQTEDEMLAHVFFFNCMGTDGAQGRFDLDAFGKLTLSFTGGNLADHPVFQKIERILQQMAQGMGGQYVPFPLWSGLADRKIVTVHPLGGCPMGGSSTEGVVDTQGRIFNTTGGAKTVYPGLYVADASTIPGPLAVNPTLTIVALALKIAQNL